MRSRTFSLLLTALPTCSCALWAGAIILLGLGGAARAGTVVLMPSADAELREASPLAPFGTGTTMVSGGLGDNADNTRRRGLVKFDLSDAIPPGSTLTSVVVKVSVVLRLPGAAADSHFGLHRLLRSWRESAVTWTWANNPIAPWGEAGASAATDSVVEASASVPVSGLGQYTFSSTPQLLADVQGWLDDPASNAGWLLRSDTEAPFTARHFGTREVPANAATLTVGYEPPPPLKPPLILEVMAVGGEISFGVEVQAGVAYIVESSQAVAGEDWEPVASLAPQSESGIRWITNSIQRTSGYFRVGASAGSLP